MKRPQTKFSVHTMRESQDVRSKKKFFFVGSNLYLFLFLFIDILLKLQQQILICFCKF